jgi:hypothetical protein
MIAIDIRKADYLRQCLRFPRLLIQVNKRLVSNQEAMVGEADFMKQEDKALFRLLRDRAETAVEDVTPVADIEKLCDSLDDLVLKRRIQELMVLPEISESKLDRLPDHLVVSVLDWRYEWISGQVNEVQRLFNEAKEAQDLDLVSMFSQELRELPSRKLRLYKARGAMKAVNRRLEKEIEKGEK